MLAQYCIAELALLMILTFVANLYIDLGEHETPCRGNSRDCFCVLRGANSKKSL